MQEFEHGPGLRHMAEFFRRGGATNKYGQSSPDLTSLGKRRVACRYQRAREMVDTGGSPQDIRKAIIHVRGDAMTKSLKSDDTVEVRGRRHKIESSFPRDPAGRWIEIHAVAGVAV